MVDMQRTYPLSHQLSIHGFSSDPEQSGLNYSNRIFHCRYDKTGIEHGSEKVYLLPFEEIHLLILQNNDRSF